MSESNKEILKNFVEWHNEEYGEEQYIPNSRIGMYLNQQ